MGRREPAPGVGGVQERTRVMASRLANCKDAIDDNNSKDASDDQEKPRTERRRLRENLGEWGIDGRLPDVAKYWAPAPWVRMEPSGYELLARSRESRGTNTLRQPKGGTTGRSHRGSGPTHCGRG
jgi:hypothetical protein